MSTLISANLFELLRARAPSLETIALENPEGTSLSYGDLFARAGRCKYSFRGVQRQCGAENARSASRILFMTNL